MGAVVVGAAVTAATAVTAAAPTGAADAAAVIGAALAATAGAVVRATDRVAASPRITNNRKRPLVIHQYMMVELLDGGTRMSKYCKIGVVTVSEGQFLRPYIRY